MKSTIIKAAVPAKDDKEAKGVTVSYEMPETLAEAEAAFGATPILDGFRADFTVYIQGVARSMLKAGKGQGEIQAAVSALKPGVKRTATIDIQAAVKAKLSTMTPEGRQAYIAELMGE